MRRWQRFLVVVPAALMLWGCAAGQIPGGSGGDPEKLTRLGSEAHDRGDYQTAISLYQEGLRKAPHEAGLWNRLGIAYHGSRNYPEAVKAYEKALEIGPDAVVWTNLGLAHYEMGNYAEAASAYAKALEIEPTAARWTRLGNSRYAQGGYAEAITAYTKALAIAPADEKAVHWRGWAHYANKDYNKAIVDFDQVVRSKEYGESALRGRGWSYSRKGMYGEARQDFTAALGINPKSNDGFLGRGWAHYYTGSFKEAVKDFTGAIDNTGPESKEVIRDALHGKALAFLGLDDLETAVFLLEKAQATAPLNEWSRIVFYYFSGDRQKAWQLRGGEGMIGAEIRDLKKGTASGAEVVGFQKGSPAAEARFLEGDVIVAVNATPVSGMDECVRAIAALQPGTIAEIVVVRESREKKIPVRVGSAERAILSDPMAGPLVREGMASRGGEIPAAGGIPAASFQQNGSGGAAGDELF